MQTIKSSGVFHGLPQYTENGEKNTVLVVGAKRITGANVVKVLSEKPERWSTIYALSRKAPANPLAANVEHLSIDLLTFPAKVAEGLK